VGYPTKIYTIQFNHVLAHNKLRQQLHIAQAYEALVGYFLSGRGRLLVVARNDPGGAGNCSRTVPIEVKDLWLKTHPEVNLCVGWIN